MKYLLFFVLFAALSSPVLAQYSEDQLNKIVTTYSEEKLVLESSRLLEEGYYVQAERMIDKLLSYQPENANYNYRKGFVLSEGRGNFAAAIPHFEKGAKNVGKNYDMYSGRETRAPIDVLYHLAKAYHRTGDIDRADEQYKAFLAQASKGTDLTAAAELGVGQIAIARRSIEFQKRNVNVVNLGPVINTEYPEYSPVVSFDGSALYFTSRRGWGEGQSEESRDQRYDLYPEDIYVSYKDFDDSWIEPVRLEFCKPDQNEASISVSPDEHRIYVYQDITGNGDIFYSDFSTNRFREIRHYDNKNVNSDWWDTHCAVTPDGRTMYFASERPDGYGGRDLYRIVKMADGTWGEPMNLGPRVNSAFDEDSPFMASDNKTLYFSSNGPKSMGGFDILVTVLDADNNWSDPINLGYPMNSTADDLFYTETLDGRRGYITSMRGDTRGEKDIYEVQNDYLTVNRGAILKGKVIVVNGDPLPEDITITLACNNCGSDLERTVYPRQRDGAFMINLEPCREYEVIFRKNDNADEFYRETMKTDCVKEKDEIYREIYLDAEKYAIVAPPKDTTPVVTDTIPPVIVLNGKHFDPLSFRHNFAYNRNKLTVKSGEFKRFVNAVEKQLKDGRDEAVIEIYSSASYVPTVVFASNQELSQTRADNMKRDLEAYFAQSKYKGKVKITIAEVKVSGPAYADDRDNLDKYGPYQYVELKVAAKDVAPEPSGGR